MSTQQRGLPQSHDALLKSYASKLRDDINSMLENFEEILRLGKYEENSELSTITQSELDTYEMHVRAANMVRAGESLMKLTADLKQNLILNDLRSVSEALVANSRLYRMQAGEMDYKLATMRDDMLNHLFDLEEEYYMSNFKRIRKPMEEEK